MKLNQIAANVTELNFKNHRVLFSYDTLVAYQYKAIYFRTSSFHSATTTKHINNWLNGIIAQEIEQDKIDKLIK